MTTIKRGMIQDGYVIIPAEMIDDELTESLDISGLISAKEIIAMCASAMLEINRGDNKPTSLNVKLYKSIRDYASLELDKLLDKLIDKGIK